jgi:hypothetical protein
MSNYTVEILHGMIITACQAAETGNVPWKKALEDIRHAANAILKQHEALETETTEQGQLGWSQRLYERDNPRQKALRRLRTHGEGGFPR